MIEGTRRGSAGNNGPAGLFEQDDIDNWRSVTESAKSQVARNIPQDLSMGAGRYNSHLTYPGQVSDEYISEHNQRGFYTRWEEFMNASSWDDIPIDPISASFEGSAEMDD